VSSKTRCEYNCNRTIDTRRELSEPCCTSADYATSSMGLRKILGSNAPNIVVLVTPSRKDDDDHLEGEVLLRRSAW